MDLESYRIWLKDELSRKSQFVKNNEELCGCDLRTLGLSEYEIFAPKKIQNKPNVSLQCIINHGHERCHVGWHPQIAYAFPDKRLECEGCSRKLLSLVNACRYRAPKLSKACGTVYCDSCATQLRAVLVNFDKFPDWSKHCTLFSLDSMKRTMEAKPKVWKTDYHMFGNKSGNVTIFAAPASDLWLRFVLLEVFENVNLVEELISFLTFEVDYIYVILKDGLKNYEFFGKEGNRYFRMSKKQIRERVRMEGVNENWIAFGKMIRKLQKKKKKKKRKKRDSDYA